MKKLKLLMIIISFLLVQAIVVFSGCSKEIESNRKPVLDINSNTEGLKVTIAGNTNDSDGTISELTIDWGDNNIDKLDDIDFANFEETHTYPEPATYTIIVTVIDNDGDNANKSLLAIVDFKEVDLENIKEGMFKSADNEYLILTINLHTYQEDRQNEKFNMLVEVIGKMDIDFIAFQECAQHKSAAITGGIIREDNMALIVSNNLQETYGVDYNFVWDWAHYGWTVWEEGVAVLSKHPLIDTDNRYVSSGTSTSNITSRKVIYGSFQTPEGVINVFSAHTHWRTSLTDVEQNNQIKNIQLMVDEKEALNPVEATFVCGDFNVNPTSDFPWSEGYYTMINNDEYVDTFLEIYTDANNKPAQSIYNTIEGDFPGRIDYVFKKNNTYFNVVDAQIIFTDNVVGRISDHYGVLTKVTISQ